MNDEARWMRKLAAIGERIVKVSDGDGYVPVEPDAVGEVCLACDGDRYRGHDEGCPLDAYLRDIQTPSNAMIEASR